MSTAEGRSRRSRRTGLTGTDGVDGGANGSVAELGRGSSILWMEIDCDCELVSVCRFGKWYGDGWFCESLQIWL